MQLHPTKLTEKELQNSKIFFNAYDEYNERNRRLFDIPEIDRQLIFEDKKNVCIINNSSSNISDIVLYSMISNACITYHLDGDDITFDNDIRPKKKMTLLIDAGNGNNLGNIYLDLVKKSSTDEFDIKEILKQIVILRAFTFRQMLNILMNVVPQFIYQLNGNCKIQIIILDLLDTLIESSNRSIVSKNDNCSLKSKKDFESNEKLIIEAIDMLINLSNDHFVILTYDNSANVIDDSLFYKFDNHLEIDVINYLDNSKRIMRDADKVKAVRKDILLKIKSTKNTSSMSINHLDICNSEYRSLSSRKELFSVSSNEEDLTNLCVL